MKKLLMRVLPEQAVQFIRLIRRKNRERTLTTMLESWRVSRGSITRVQNSLPQYPVIIMPGDPNTIALSLGDDAMITAITQHVRAVDPQAEIGILHRGDAAARLLAARNYRPIELPSEADIPTSFPKLLEQHPAHKFIVVGADVMDGYYSPHFSASTIIMADLAARAGVDSSILGFSFNASAHKKLKPFFDELHSDVKVNLRDAFSLRRFRKFTTCDGQIVADSAFLLKPSSAPADASAWIRSRKENGDTVVGINIHPMLFRHTTADQLNMIIGRFSAALCKATIEMKVSFFLLPHDYRDSSGDGDGIVLRPVLQKIEQEFPDRIFYLEGQHRAADLKATAGLLDGIITARMHLAIAALGMGVPIMCFTYQDKFEGLFDHFELDADMLIDPRVFIEGTRFDEEIKSFIKNIPLLREKIRERLPEVTRLAELNFR